MLPARRPEGAPRAPARAFSARVILAGILWALPFALAIAAQIAGIPLLPVVLLASFFWLAGDALGWKPFAKAKSAFASIRA